MIFVIYINSGLQRKPGYLYKNLFNQNQNLKSLSSKQKNHIRHNKY